MNEDGGRPTQDLRLPTIQPVRCRISNTGGGIEEILLNVVVNTVPIQTTWLAWSCQLPGHFI